MVDFCQGTEDQHLEYSFLEKGQWGHFEGSTVLPFQASLHCISGMTLRDPHCPHSVFRREDRLCPGLSLHKAQNSVGLVCHLCTPADWTRGLVSLLLTQSHVSETRPRWSAWSYSAHGGHDRMFTLLQEKKRLFKAGSLSVCGTGSGYSERQRSLHV